MTNSDFIEIKQIEFKREYTDNILKTIAAYANFEGGKILISIDEIKKEIVGVLDYINLKLNIENKINDSIKPRPKYEINTLVYDNNKILEIFVYPGLNTPYLLKGLSYQRQDTSTVPVDQSTLLELSLKGKNIAFDQLVKNITWTVNNFVEKKLREIKNSFIQIQ